VGNLVFIILLLKSLNTLSQQLLDYFWTPALSTEIPALVAHAAHCGLAVFQIRWSKNKHTKEMLCAHHTQKISSSDRAAQRHVGKQAGKQVGGLKERWRFISHVRQVLNYFAQTVFGWTKSFIGFIAPKVSKFHQSKKSIQSLIVNMFSLPCVREMCVPPGSGALIKTAAEKCGEVREVYESMCAQPVICAFMCSTGVPGLFRRTKVGQKSKFEVGAKVTF
jgi:hypothetical protein